MNKFEKRNVKKNTGALIFFSSAFESYLIYIAVEGSIWNDVTPSKVLRNDEDLHIPKIISNNPRESINTIKSLLFLYGYYLC